MFENVQIELFARPLLCLAHISPASFEQPTPFPYIPYLHLTIAHTSTVCLCTSARRTFLEFKILVIDRTFQVAGFSIFGFIFNDYSERGKNNYAILRNARSPGHSEGECR
jgi:hypothetical protein